MSRQSTKNKKYALRKIGKFFGSCAVATVITLGGAAIMAPNVTVYASDTTANGEADIDSLSDSNAGYEVIIPKGKKYIRNDEIESHTPVLKEEGYNGRSFILPKEGEDSYFFDHPMSEVFTKLYDKDNDGNIDDKYKNPEPVDNSHAGETIDGATVPYRSEINPKYPHVVDSGLTGDSLNAPGVWKYNPDGKYAPSDGVINDQDTIVVARKPIMVDENANDNVVKEDGSVVLTGEYKIHVNEGDHIDKKDDVYEVGTKPKEEKTPIPFETRYERDDSVPEGTEEVVTAGVNGETVKTTTYELNPTTGEVTPNEPTTTTTNPVTKVVKRGTQPKEEKTPIPFETRYERDDSVPEGTEEVVTAGVDGETVKTTTYELNPTTGEVTANEPTTTTTNPVTKVVKRGTQPKEEKTPIPFETRYEDDNSIPEGEEREVIAGVNGETVKTTTYELNPTTGEVTANEPTTKTTDPVTRVVKRGTQPKPGETPETPQPKPGETPETPQPKPGATPETPQPKPGETPETPQPKPGETPETPQPKPGETPETPQPKPGETPETPQPKPGETPETPQPKPGETPETPQPKPGETPETPQPKPGETPETPQPETGINVIPPTPRIVERSGGNTVEVEVPNKDADTLSITFTKRNSAEKETIVTKKDNGTWMIEKAPKGVTINPTNGLVYIPSKQIEPKTYVDTQTKHKNKESKIVSVVPNIHDLKEFEATTEWIDVNGNVLKTLEKGIHKKEKFASYVWLESVLEGNKIRHIYFEGTPIVEKPEYKITVWFDEDGNPIKPDQPGTHESGEIPGYKFITTTTKDGITTHIFEKVANGTPILPERPTSHPRTPSSSPSTSTPEKPNKAQTPSPEQPASPAPSKVSEQKGEAVATATSEKTVDSVTSTKASDKAELPNTGTEANANLAALGLLGALSGFGLLARKKKED